MNDMLQKESMVTADRFGWLKGVIGITLVLNIADALFTVYWVESGRGTEANPLLQPLTEGHPLLFIVIKLALVSLGLWLLWRLRQCYLAVTSIMLSFVAYYWVVLYHFHGFMTVL